jgi:hypothetical protein
MKKEALFKRPLMKKEANPKNAKGLVQKTSDEKGGNPKNAKGLIQKTFDEKRSRHSKSLVPHRKFENLNSNLKRASSRYR